MICKIKYEKDGNEIIPYGLRLIPDFGYWANWEKEDDSPKLESIDIN